MKLTVKKLYKGCYASVRDYQVEKCIQKGEDLTIDFDGERMKIPLEQVKEAKAKFHNTTFKSKVGGKDYELIDFFFKPNA